MSNMQKEIDKLIDLYFKQFNILYEHLFLSYHQFIEEIIPYCLKQEKNYFYENISDSLIHFHGFKCENIRIKPATFDNDNEIKFPNDARKNHLSYFASIIVDIKQYVETINILNGDKTIKDVHVENNIAVGNIPIMVKSKYCSTFIKKDIHGECKYDPGGYFIVSGQEKIVLSIEKMADNKVLIFTKKDSAFENGVIYTAHINSRKNDWSDNLQIAVIKNRKDGVLSLTSSQLIDVPILIILRAFGFETDQEIIENICYSLDDVKMINLLRPSINFCQDEDGNVIKTKEEAINYLIGRLNRSKRISSTDEQLAKKQKIIMLDKILRQDLLQHLGEDIPKKRMFICMMINKLLLVMLNKIEPDDRDGLHNKRIETPGVLLGQLFRQNWKKMLSDIGKHFREKNQSDERPMNVISQIKSTTIEQGIKKALATGIWGMNRTKTGVAQPLQRLCWAQSQSYLRRIMTPDIDSAKSGVISIRRVNNSQYKFLCVSGDTEILLSKFKTKQIKDITENDEVVTVNSNNLDISVSKIFNFFKINPDKLYKIVTYCNRTIKATKDHPFLVSLENRNVWKKLEDLKLNDILFLYYNDGYYTSKIISIEEIEVEPVYDFTTLNNDHSFIANCFVTHNCPVETPEGAKIGIVKSMAMMSSITTQNNSQEKVIHLIFKNNNNIKHSADVNPLEMNTYVKIFTNGNWYGVIKIKYALEVYQDLKNKRKENIIDKYTCFLFDYEKKEIRIYFDGGRLIRPLLVVNDNQLNLTLPIIDYINEEQTNHDVNKSWIRLITKYHNIIEYEDIETCNHLMIADRFEKLSESIDNSKNIIEYKESTKVNRYGDFRYVKHTHCEFHGWVMLGTIAANIPFLNHDYATKSIVHFSHAKNTMGTYLTSYKDRMDISQVLYHPQIPIAQTKAMKYNNILDMPYGENTILAIMSYTGYNQEDSLIINQSAIDRGLFRADSIKKYHAEIVKNPSTSQDDIFTKPDANKVTGMKQGNYSKLNEFGFAPEETEILNNDIIIGKVSPIQPTGNNNKVYKDNSEQFKSNVTGVIDRVHSNIYNAEGYEMYNIRIRMERIPIIGDKFCCLPSSEILTNNGWIQIKDIDINKHKVATFNKDNNLTYVYPSNKFIFDHCGSMYHYKSNHIHIQCTLNHKLYVKHNNKYQLIDANTIIGKNVKMKNNINNNCISIDTININDKFYNMNSFLVLLGLYITNGHISNKSLIISYKYRKYNFIDKTKIEYLESIFEKLNITFIFDKIKKQYIINNYDIITYIQKNVGENINKKYPNFVWNLSKEQAQLLLLYQLTDDTTKYYIDNNNVKQYYIDYITPFVNHNIANQISRLCLHCEWTGHIQISTFRKAINTIFKINYYKVIINTNVNEPCKNSNCGIEQIFQYTGKVYCIEVPESHVYYMRENILSPPILIGNSNRHGQKGTVGIILPQRDMPFTHDGMVPDMLMNVHSLPSRMTVGQLVESLASKEAAITGHFVDGTPFSDYNIKEIPELLKKLGYSPHGTEVMYNGMTGKKMDAEIFIGPTYQIRLKHLVQDKIHGRARGPRQALTRQPLEGRSRDGGFKVGEMEKDAIIAHGMGQFLKERMMETSDITKIYVCDDCGLFASKVIDKDYYSCKSCHNTTRISAVVIPYACKLLFQELMAVNILPRIRTDNNIFNYDA